MSGQVKNTGSKGVKEKSLKLLKPKRNIYFHPCMCESNHIYTYVWWDITKTVKRVLTYCFSKAWPLNNRASLEGNEDLNW